LALGEDTLTMFSVFTHISFVGVHVLFMLFVFMCNGVQHDFYIG
jgi:hypothetical protein